MSWGRSLALGLLAAAACTAKTTEPIDAGRAADAAVDAGAADTGPNDAGFLFGAIPPEPQRAGDPATGYAVLVNDGYVGCGVPYSAYRQVAQPAPEALRLPGRFGANSDLPYDFSAFDVEGGVRVVSPNCLSCHASFFRGEVVVGLGDANRDFTGDASATAEAAGFLITDPGERAAWRKWADRVSATAPYIRPRVFGANPADNLAAILFAHRDRETLAWSDTPLMEPPPTEPLPVDVPPWWRMKKKNAMFYHAAGRGDHARIMMTASVLCVDSVDVARRIDESFPDVRAYISSIEAPPYPNEIDGELAAEGADFFVDHCARCHGTESDYPNLVIPLDEVGTDPLLSEAAPGYGGRFGEWFNGSFYGERSRFDPADGYVAPPLDGIWATAPYLHNGSVPDLATLLDSETRPEFFIRSRDSNAYDLDRLGWPYSSLSDGQDAEPDPAQRVQIYDTTIPGYGNGGHTFGDALSGSERLAVIEYLKTL